MSDSALLAILREEAPRLRSTLRQIYAVVWANLMIFFSYKYSVITDLLSMAASIVMYFFMGMLVIPTQLSSRGYGNSYAAFVLVGVATQQYLWICLSRLSHMIQHDIRGGTLETVAVTQIRMGAYFLGQTIRGYLISLVSLMGMFAVGVFALGIPLVINLYTFGAFLLAFILMIVANQAIGFITAGIVMVYKRGDPVTFILSGLNEFLSGVLYPLDMLKQFPIVYWMAQALPYTYALDAMRKALIGGGTILSPDIYFDVIALVIFSIVLLPIGLKALQMGYDKIRENGTMATY